MGRFDILLNRYCYMASLLDSPQLAIGQRRHVTLPEPVLRAEPHDRVIPDPQPRQLLRGTLLAVCRIDRAPDRIQAETHDAANRRSPATTARAMRSRSAPCCQACELQAAKGVALAQRETRKNEPPLKPDQFS